MKTRLVSLLLLVGAGLSAQAPPETRAFGSSGAVAFDAMVADLAKLDVVFVSEEQAGSGVQRAELALLEGVAKLDKKLVLALASLERDAQEPLEHLLMQHTTDAEFLAEARPRAAFASHQPLLNLAIKRMWPVMAANAPARIVAAVLQGGSTALSGLPAADTALIAKDLNCEPPATSPAATPTDTSVQLIRRMVSRFPGDTKPAQGVALCLEDETIAESIVQSHLAGSIGGAKPTVVAVVDAVYADFREGAVTALARRAPQLRIASVRVVPVNVLPNGRPNTESPERSDYVVFVN